MNKGLIIFFAASTLIGCNQKSEVEVLREELGEKNTELATLKGEIDKLHEKIEKKEPPVEDSLDVYVTKVNTSDFSSYVDVQGIVKTDKNVTVIPEANGVIKKIFVRSGQNVKIGQVLAQIDDAILRRNLAELETGLELAEELFQKQKKLREQNVGTEVQYLQTKNQRDALLASKSTVVAQLSKTTLRSPIEGKIDEIFPNTGEMASPMTAFCRIVSTNSLYINAEVSESFYNTVNIGDSIEAYFGTTEERSRLVISYKGNYINPGNRTFKIGAAIKGNYPPNTITIIKIRDRFIPNAIVVSTKVLQSDLKGYYVYKIKGNTAQKQYVEIGDFHDGKTVITNGISVNDVLVIKGYKTLSDKSIVKINK